MKFRLGILMGCRYRFRATAYRMAIGMNNIGRMCIGCTGLIYGRAVNGQLVTAYLGDTRPAGARNMIYLDWLMCLTFYHFTAGAIIIATTTTTTIGFSDIAGAAQIYTRSLMPIIFINIGTIKIVWCDKYPIIVRIVVNAAYIVTGAHWRPATITAAIAPRYPRWCPLITGDPNPAVVAIIRPTAVMVACPCPWLIRHPHVSLVCHSPVTV